MTNRSKILAAALGLLVAGGTVADASAATLVTRTRTVVTRHAVRPVVAARTLRIVHRVARPYPVTARFVTGYRVTPRVHVARAVVTRHIIKKTVVR